MWSMTSPFDHWVRASIFNSTCKKPACFSPHCFLMYFPQLYLSSLKDILSLELTIFMWHTCWLRRSRWHWLLSDENIWPHFIYIPAGGLQAFLNHSPLDVQHTGSVVGAAVINHFPHSVVEVLHHQLLSGFKHGLWDGLRAGTSRWQFCEWQPPHPPRVQFLLSRLGWITFENSIGYFLSDKLIFIILFLHQWISPSWIQDR